MSLDTLQGSSQHEDDTRSSRPRPGRTHEPRSDHRSYSGHQSGDYFPGRNYEYRECREYRGNVDGGKYRIIAEYVGDRPSTERPWPPRQERASSSGNTSNDFQFPDGFEPREDSGVRMNRTAV